VIAAETAADVQAGINFANQTSVRLIVKGTGHDALGRSAGAGSLSIWTHLLRGINVTMKDPVSVSHDAVASVKLGAGMVWGDIYKEMGNMNLTVVGGADPHVGIGGWTQGSGHGPLTSYFGMGADQVFQMEVVTADGEFRFINTTSSPDIF
jgi:FAD/FMN-containing dehydrogenase